MRRLTSGCKIWQKKAPNLAALVIALTAAAIAALAAYAAASPPVQLADARCYRSIQQTDDLLCIGEYQLPQQTTAAPTPVAAAEAWCLYLQNPVGCDTN